MIKETKIIQVISNWDPTSLVEKLENEKKWTLNTANKDIETLEDKRYRKNNCYSNRCFYKLIIVINKTDIKNSI